MLLTLDPSSIEDYRRFCAVKRLPSYRIRGRQAWFPDEYAHLVGIETKHAAPIDYKPTEFLFDYQRDISRLAINKRKFAVFADCGLGKTLIMAEFCRNALQSLPGSKRVLIISPLMVVPQTSSEFHRFYLGDLAMDEIPARKLSKWLQGKWGEHRLGITNYDAMKGDLKKGCLVGLVLDESSMLKSHYGKWGTAIIQLGKGVEWKLCCTGTPAPNDRIEYANHAVFLDHYPTVNSFLATYFVNRGQTSERWVLKDHALGPFYRALSHWCIFVTNPATYGWKDNCDTIPPINVHIHQVDITSEQRKALHRETGQMFAAKMGGISSRGKLGQISKGQLNGKKIATNKPEYIASLVKSWPDESTIIWCIYNAEQETMERAFPEALSIRGSTKHEDRLRMIDDFKSGRNRVLISKPKILGFGLNLEIATRQVFSGLQDSYESYYQAVKRSNRIGSKKPLNVHIPVTELEEPMVQNVLRKADRVQHDTEEQERIFNQCRIS